MSVPLEHDYIGLANASSMERSSESSNISSESESNNVLNLKATELRLGLPGFCEENGKVKNFMSAGAKRGFSDVNIDGSEKWDLNNSGSESDLEKNQTQKLVSVLDVKSIEEKNKSPVSAPSAK